MESVTQSQNKAILAHMRQGKRINPSQALELFGCMRLASRICDIRPIAEALGEEIKTRMIRVTNRQGKAVFVSEYWVEKTTA